jgi:hypothetical protein
MLARQRKCWSIYDLGKFVNYLIYRKFIIVQKLTWQNKEHTINRFGWGKTCVFPGL